MTLRGTKNNPITDGDRVSATDALKAEIAFDFTINQLTIVRTNGVPAARVFYDESFQPPIYSLTSNL